MRDRFDFALHSINYIIYGHAPRYKVGDLIMKNGPLSKITVYLSYVLTETQECIYCCPRYLEGNYVSVAKKTEMCACVSVRSP